MSIFDDAKHIETLARWDSYLVECMSQEPKELWKRDRASWRGYDRLYSKYLSDKSYDEFNMLEIGVYKGYGIKGWRDYFDSATIYGLDYSPHREAPDVIDMSNIHIGPQNDPEVWKGFPMFDVIIDDANHHPEIQWESLDIGQHYLNSGGLYFLEDCGPLYGGDLDLLSERILSLGWEYEVYWHFNAQRWHRYLDGDRLFYFFNAVPYDLPNDLKVDNPLWREYIVVMRKP